LTNPLEKPQVLEVPIPSHQIIHMIKDQDKEMSERPFYAIIEAKNGKVDLLNKRARNATQVLPRNNQVGTQLGQLIFNRIT